VRVLLILTPLLLLSPLAAAALSANYNGLTTSCPVRAYPDVGALPVPWTGCVTTDHGTLTVTSCTTTRCTVRAAGGFASEWQTPGVFGGITNLLDETFQYWNWMCQAGTGYPTPGTQAGCEGTASGSYNVAASQCREIRTLTLVWYDSVGGGVDPVYAEAHREMEITHAFRLCRDGAGAASIVRLS